MSYKHKILEFLNYTNAPMSKEQIVLTYNAHDIKYEKCELFNDFVQSLTILVFDTYMGDELTDTIEKQKNHFTWCWNKNTENFFKEGITIGDTKSFEYFMDFMFDVYYPKSKKGENATMHLNIQRLWIYIFDYNNIKSKSDIDTLIEIYKLLDATLTVKN